jgi:hypothetical protein
MAGLFTCTRLFEEQVKKLISRSGALQAKDPLGYREQPPTKRLATINRYIREIIPRDPNAAEFRQGNILLAQTIVTGSGRNSTSVTAFLSVIQQRESHRLSMGER